MKKISMSDTYKLNPQILIPRKPSLRKHSFRARNFRRFFRPPALVQASKIQKHFISSEYVSESDTIRGWVKKANKFSDLSSLRRNDVIIITDDWDGAFLQKMYD